MSARRGHKREEETASDTLLALGQESDGRRNKHLTNHSYSTKEKESAVHYLGTTKAKGGQNRRRTGEKRILLLR